MNYRELWANGDIEAGTLVDAIESQAREIERLHRESGEAISALVAQRDQLRKDISTLTAQPSGVVPEAVIEALKFYAEGAHFVMHELVWDTVSGEPANFYEDENNTATVEDGSIAKAALERLNSSPVSAGEPCACDGNPHTTQCRYEHFLTYSGLSDQPLLRYAYFHGAEDHCEQPVSAGDGMCNADNPEFRCICREEFGYRVCVPSAGGVDERVSVPTRLLRRLEWAIADLDDYNSELLELSAILAHEGEPVAWMYTSAEFTPYVIRDRIVPCPDGYAEHALRAALTAPAPNHGEQVLVPVEPTEEMQIAAGRDDGFCHCCGYDNGGGDPSQLWREMLAAAPSASSQGGE